MRLKSRGALRWKRFELVDRTGAVHLEVTCNSLRANTSTGKVVAVNAGIGENFHSQVLSEALDRSAPLRGVWHTLKWNPHSRCFLVHVANLNQTGEVTRSLEAPYRHLFRLNAMLENEHHSNEAIRRIINRHYARVEVDNSALRQVARNTEPKLSIATVEKNNVLHVSLHEVPSYVDPMQGPQRFGSLTWQINERMKRDFIDELRGLGVGYLYLVSAQGHSVEVKDLEKAAHEAAFIP